MLASAPAFWWDRADWKGSALAPAGWAYGKVAVQLLDRAPRHPVVCPVICVGNFTVGGTGKTPVAIALAGHARARGLKPGFLSRGHGGSSPASRLVDPAVHTATDVGDEPLLLARAAPVAVGADRSASARLLLERGCDLIILDDGFQSARLLFDYALIVADAERGIGNGRVLPAGPLRAPLASQIARMDALLVMGNGPRALPLIDAVGARGKPVYRASLTAIDPGSFKRKPFVAFAGIGNPEKFFATLRGAGAELADLRAFPDHHVYARADLEALAALAASRHAELVTTAKDAVRIDPAVAPSRFVEALRVMEIEVDFSDPALPTRILDQAIARYRARAAV